MTQHTALPWAPCKDGAAYHEPMTIVRDNYVVCGGLEEEDAAFIVKACNSHYELLEALKNIAEREQARIDKDRRINPNGLTEASILIITREAIAKAEAA